MTGPPTESKQSDSDRSHLPVTPDMVVAAMVRDGLTLKDALRTAGDGMGYESMRKARQKRPDLDRAVRDAIESNRALRHAERVARTHNLKNLRRYDLPPEVLAVEEFSRRLREDGVSDLVGAVEAAGLQSVGVFFSRLIENKQAMAQYEAACDLRAALLSDKVWSASLKTPNSGTAIRLLLETQRSAGKLYGNGSVSQKPPSLPPKSEASVGSILSAAREDKQEAKETADFRKMWRKSRAAWFEGQKLDREQRVAASQAADELEAGNTGAQVLARLPEDVSVPVLEIVTQVVTELGEMPE